MYIVVDVESDGKYPGDYSMICFGAVVVTPELNKTFYGRTAPISALYEEDTLAISKYSRAEHEAFPDPATTMKSFAAWVKQMSPKRRPTFMSDNLAYDWQWINYYMHKYTGENIFGYSGRRIADLYCGMQMNTGAPWKHLRKTKHTHHPVDDAKGNAEVLLQLKEMGLSISFKQ